MNPMPALLVRYVLDRSAVDPETMEVVRSDQLRPKPTTRSSMPKCQFCTSWDLAVQVAEALGPKRVLPDAKGDPSINEAAGAIFSGLKSLLQKIVTLFKFPILILDQKSRLWS